jgi:hypothetical protein
MPVILRSPDRPIARSPDAGLIDTVSRMMPWLRWWADLLDSRFQIPGTGIRFGIDPILSLIPGLGDLASPVFAVALMVQGVRQRVPRVVLLRMLGNALIDALIGAVPIAGAVGDIFWRANLRNLALLERHATRGVRPSRSDYIFVWTAAAIFGLLVAIPVFLAIYLFAELWRRGVL